MEIIQGKLMSLIESNLPDELEDLVDSAEREVQAAIHWVKEHAPNVPVTRGGTPSRPAAGSQGVPDGNG